MHKDGQVLSWGLVIARITSPISSWHKKLSARIAALSVALNLKFSKVTLSGIYLSIKFYDSHSTECPPCKSLLTDINTYNLLTLTLKIYIFCIFLFALMSGIVWPWFFPSNMMHRSVILSLVLVISLLQMSCSLYVFSPPDLSDGDRVPSSSPSSVSSSSSSLEGYTGLPPAFEFSAALYSLSQMDTDVMDS